MSIDYEATDGISMSLPLQDSGAITEERMVQEDRNRTLSSGQDRTPMLMSSQQLWSPAQGLH